MKIISLAVLACLVMSCSTGVPKNSIQEEVPKIDGYEKYIRKGTIKIWVDEATGCQYWIIRGHHSGRLGMSPRYSSKGTVVGCLGD